MQRVREASRRLETELNERIDAGLRMCQSRGIRRQEINNFTTITAPRTAVATFKCNKLSLFATDTGPAHTTCDHFQTSSL